LDKEILIKLKKESLWLLVLLAVSLILFKIVFYKESILVILKTTLSLYWLFVLPGFALMYYWEKKLGFAERFVIGIFIQAAIVGIMSYYLGLLGLHVKYSGIVIPVLSLAVGFYVMFFLKEKVDKSAGSKQNS
jgi:uncharacterized membrane protein